MTRPLLRRADSLVEAEAPRWRDTWRDFYHRRHELADAEAGAEWHAYLDDLDGMTEAERDASYLAAEAARAAYGEELDDAFLASTAAPDEWDAWWRSVLRTLDGVEATQTGPPRLDLWPHTLPAPPPASETEPAERAQLLADFRAAKPGTPRRVAFAYLLYFCALVDALREARS